MTSVPAIGFEYRPSRWPARLLTVVALLALAAVALCGLAWWLRCLLAFLLVLAWRHAARAPARPVTAAGWAGGAGGWSLHRADGSDTPATLASSRVLGAFVLLRLRDARGAVTLVLAPDNSDADIRRRLRMRLAAGAAPG